jgi:multiple sugar transport system substrate-binding protein
MRRRNISTIAGLALSALMLTACSGGDDAHKKDGNNTAGPITLVVAKDQTASARLIVDRWNVAHSDQKVTIKELAAESDQRHQDLVSQFTSKASGNDVLSLSSGWVAEFAAQKWLQPLEDDYALNVAGLIKPAVGSVRYSGHLYAAPIDVDAGLLFYRSDLVKNPPKTWAELISSCSVARANNMGCFAGQYAKFEGLAANVAEAIYSSGGEITKSDGVTPNVDTPQAKAGVQFLVDGYKNGTIPREAITYRNAQTARAFEAGQLLFMRNWSGAFVSASTSVSSKVRGKFKVAQLPGPDGAGVSVLDVHSLAINADATHKRTALEFIKFAQSPDIQRLRLEQAGLAPVLTASYDDGSLQQKIGYLSTLKDSLSSAKTMPVTPRYADVSVALQDNAYAAITRTKPVDQALKDLQAAIEAAK